MLISRSSLLTRIVSGRCVRARSTPAAEESKDVSNRIPGQTDDTKLKDYTEIPGPKALPIIGTLYKYLPYFGSYSFGSLFGTSQARFKEYGPLVREVIVGNICILHTYDPHDIETVLRFSGKYPERRSHLSLGIYRKTKPHLYNNGGILTENGTEWYEIRSLFQKPISSPKSARTYLVRTDNVISEFIDRIKRVYCANGPGIAPDFLKDFNRLNFQMVSLIIFDEKIDSFSESEMLENSVSSKVIRSSEYVNKTSATLDNFIDMLKYIQLPLYKTFTKNIEVLEEVAANFIYKKIQIFKNKTETNPESEPSLLELYLANPQINFKDLLAMCVDLLLGGIDTTSNTTSFAVYNVATRPEIQEKLYHESLTLLPNANDPITDEIINKAVYMKACLKESLRLFPVSIGIGRLLTQDIALSGYRIPKGTTIVTHNQVACRLEKNFKNPMEFIPERWMKTNELFSHHHPYLYIPFGHGSRMCIARRFAEQNMHITLLKLFRNFEIKWKGAKELGVTTIMINKPDAPVRLEFKMRNT